MWQNGNNSFKKCEDESYWEKEDIFFIFNINTFCIFLIFPTLEELWLTYFFLAVNEFSMAAYSSIFNSGPAEPRYVLPLQTV